VLPCAVACSDGQNTREIADVAMVVAGHAAHRRIAKRLAPIARWALASVFVLVALVTIATALTTLPAIPAEQVNQIIDLDELAWGRAGAIALGLLLPWWRAPLPVGSVRRGSCR
jgi:hypothetical protein